MGSSAAATCTSAWVPAPPVMERVPAMGDAISFLRLRDGTHPLAVGPVNPGLLPGTGRSGRHCRWVPETGARPTDRSQDSPNGVGRFGGQAGTQAPDPTPVPGQNHGSRAGTTIHILPAESVLVAHGSQARQSGAHIDHFCALAGITRRRPDQFGGGEL